MLRRPVWLLVLLYAAFSILWIAAAGYLISLALDDPALRSQASFIKELVLIIASSGMFYALLKFARDTVVFSSPARIGSYFEPGCQRTQSSSPTS